MPGSPPAERAVSAGLPRGAERHIVFVVGAGRSGTSTLAGILQLLGMYVPQPEVDADETNPRGFAEPQWSVDFHNRLLRRANVQIHDARPAAAEFTHALGSREPVRRRLVGWLADQFEQADDLVIKDPRLSWFLDLWRTAAARTGADIGYVTMLRHPTEVVGSKHLYYGAPVSFANSLAAWINVMLSTERGTRQETRLYVRYEDLLADWDKPVRRIGDSLGVRSLQQLDDAAARRVAEFIDPSLRRVRVTWDDVAVPPRLQDLAERLWEQLGRLADPGGDSPDVHAALDSLAIEYRQLYADAEAVAASSIVAARRRGERAAAQLHPDPPPPVPRRLRDKIPHRVRHALPAALRAAIRDREP